MSIKPSVNYFESFFYNLPGLVFAKDLNLNYIGMNKNFLDLLQKSDDKVLGQDDYDLPWKKHAQIYQSQDRYILEKRISCQFIEPFGLSNNKEYISIVQKFINMDKQGNVIGTIGKVISIKHAKPLLKILKHMSFYKKHVFNEKLSSYIVCDDLYKEIGLNKRESECLFHLVHGKTVREIAEILYLSKRTAEKYLISLKDKMYCESKSDLIQKAIDLGMINVIPSHYLAFIQTPQAGPPSIDFCLGRER